MDCENIKKYFRIIKVGSASPPLPSAFPLHKNTFEDYRALVEDLYNSYLLLPLDDETYDTYSEYLPLLY